MVHYKLTYFNGRGLAELSRQIFAVAGKEYEDVRIVQEAWPEFKKETPFGQMPLLEVDGKKLGQSVAIARYLARKFGLAGKSDWEEAQVDALADQFKDFHTEVKPFLAAANGQPGDLEKLRVDVFDPALNKHLPLFNNAVKAAGHGFLVGSGVTFVDLAVAEFISNLISKKLCTFDAYPELKKLEEKVHAIPALKKWRESRPVTPW